MSSVTAQGSGPAVALAADSPALRAAQGLQALRGEREFRKVRQHGAVVRSPLFTLRVTPYRPRYGETWQPRAIVGIVVSKKTLKHAVKRNRVRRRMREALRTLPQLPACRATLHPTPEVLRVPFTQLQAELSRALTRGLSGEKRPNKHNNKRSDKKPASSPVPSKPARGPS